MARYRQTPQTRSFGWIAADRTQWSTASRSAKRLPRRRCGASHRRRAEHSRWLRQAVLL